MSSNLPSNIHEFHGLILNNFYNLIHQKVENNYDYNRFSHDGVDRSKEFNTNMHAFYLSWYFQHAMNIFNSFLKLSDDESKRIYISLILYRLVGHLHVKVTSAIHRNKETYEKLSEVAKPQESIFENNGMFGKLTHYDFSWEGKKYIVDCTKDGLSHSLAYGQYFYNRNGVKIMPESGDFVIDGGAFVGDTALVFSNSVGEEGKVFCFDPVEDNIKICKKNIEQFPIKNVTLYPYGLSNISCEAAPISLGVYDPSFSDIKKGHEKNNIKIPLKKLDDLTDSGEIQKVDFIKLDVEGAELQTLIGAEKTINKFKPKMAVSLYHNPNDIFEIVNFVSTKFPFYKLFIDHYTIHIEETVLYCLPQ
jgi:FkbM family methyltransferase